MGDFRLRIRLLGPLTTPFTSGGIFGQYCWSLRWAEGEAALKRLLADFEEAPLVFSDAFPAGTVPVPMLAAESRVRPELLAEADAAKRRSRRAFLPFEGFLAHRDKLNRAGLEAAFAAGPERSQNLTEHRTAHNRIDRLTNTTPASGGLYFTDELWPEVAGMEFDIYARGAEAPERLLKCFAEMGAHGFGKDASTGRGRFEVTGMEPVSGMDTAGNRWVSWSRGCCGPGMTLPRYRLYTHYGKLGGVGMQAGNPFKFPLTLWKPGGTFASEGDMVGGNVTFGRLLRNVHAERPEVVHNAMHYVVGYREES